MMKTINILFPAIWTVLISILVDNTKALPENVLIQEYFNELKINQRYNAKLPPEGKNGPGSPIQVLTSLYLLDVHKIDDFNLDYKASFYIRQSWNDSRLAYLDQDISTIVLNDVNYIWTPDLFFWQEKEGIQHNLVTPNVFLKIQPDGEVKFSTKLTVTFSCPMDFQKYPHDSQTCNFSIESYGKTRDQIYLDWDTRKHEPVSSTDQINVLAFELTELKHSARDSIVISGQYYRVLDVSLTFKRKIGFFITRLYVPFIILVSLSWLSFWIKSEMVSLRISLLLVIMYLMINIGSDIDKYIPPVPYTKGSDIWMAVCESLVFLTFLEFLLVSLLSKSEAKFEKRRYFNSTDPESLIITDPSKNEKSTSSETMGSAIKSVASHLSKRYQLSNRIDNISKILFPILFLIFNLLYWIIY